MLPAACSSCAATAGVWQRPTKFPLSSPRLDFPGTQKFTIIELPKSGTKVGIVGLTTTSTSYNSSPGKPKCDARPLRYFWARSHTLRPRNRHPP